MKYTDNSLNILTAKSYKGIGNAWIVKNLKGNERVEDIVILLNKTIKGDKTSKDDFTKDSLLVIEPLSINFHAMSSKYLMSLKVSMYTVVNQITFLPSLLMKNVDQFSH